MTTERRVLESYIGFSPYELGYAFSMGITTGPTPYLRYVKVSTGIVILINFIEDKIKDYQVANTVGITYAYTDLHSVDEVLDALVKFGDTEAIAFKRRSKIDHITEGIIFQEQYSIINTWESEDTLLRKLAITTIDTIKAMKLLEKGFILYRTEVIKDKLCLSLMPEVLNHSLNIVFDKDAGVSIKEIMIPSGSSVKVLNYQTTLPVPIVQYTRLAKVLDDTVASFAVMCWDRSSTNI